MTGWLAGKRAAERAMARGCPAHSRADIPHRPPASKHLDDGQEAAESSAVFRRSVYCRWTLSFHRHHQISYT